MKATILILQYMVINYLRPAAILPVAVFSDCCILGRILVSLANGERVEAYAGILLRIVNISDIARLFRRVKGSVLADTSDSTSLETNFTTKAETLFTIEGSSRGIKETSIQVIAFYQSIVLQKALITIGFFVMIGFICVVDEKMQKPQNTSANEPSSF